MRRAGATLVVALLGGFLLHADELARYRIIVNASNPVTALTRDQISNLFLKKVVVWGDGQAVLPADLTVRNRAREAFSKEIHGKSVSAVKSHWHQRIFSGRNVPPPEFSTDNAVIAYVKEHAGGIGYVSQAPSDARVKIVSIAEPSK